MVLGQVCSSLLPVLLGVSLPRGTVPTDGGSLQGPRRVVRGHHESGRLHHTPRRPVQLQWHLHVPSEEPPRLPGLGWGGRPEGCEER